MKTSSRLLRLLALLPTRRSWSGEELADKLSVTTRTVRNDVERLRDAGYAIDSTSGVAGGYRLAAGAELPPLLLDHDEATVVALALRRLTAGGGAGIEETSLRTLMKIEQVMPPPVRRRVKSVKEAVLMAPHAGTAAPVDVDVLSTLAAACRDHAELRFDYTSHDRSHSLRNVEPHRVVHDGRRWYLLAWDLERRDWRTFRVDRLKPRPPVGRRFTPRELPERDVAAYVARQVGRATWDYRARIKVFSSAAELSARLPASIAIEPAGEHACIAAVGSDSPQHLATYLGMLGADFEVVDGPELHGPLLQLSKRLLRAARSARNAPTKKSRSRVDRQSADRRPGRTGAEAAPEPESERCA